jgi:hypothetical protein
MPEDRFLPEHRLRICVIDESPMRYAYGHLWLIDRRDMPRWQSPVAALFVTATLFTAAFASMTRFGEPFAGTTVVDERPRLVFFSPPPVEPAKTAERPRVTPTPPNAPVRRLEHALPMPAPAVASAPLPRDNAAPDSAASSAATDPAFPFRRLEMTPAPTTARSTARGAPMAPAGVTATSTPLTSAQRDSIAKERIGDAVAEARAELGRGRGIHNANGQQAGTLSAGVSIPFPLFSSGPSAAERKRNAVIDADNQLRLRRLQDRAATHVDSVRLDSLRRDSLTRRVVRP